MNEKLDELADKVHSLSNRFVVIERAFDLFIRQQPDNRLAGIARDSLDNSMELMNEIKAITNELMEQSEKVDHSNDQQQISKLSNSEIIKSWYNELISKDVELQEMFPLKINFTHKGFQCSKHNEYTSTYDEIFMNTLDYICALGGSEVFVDLLVSPNQTFMAITDNASEVVQKDSAEFQSIENFCSKINASFNFKSIQGIGNSFKITF